MRQFKMYSIAAAGLLLLSGCSQFVDTDTVSMMAPQGNAFQNALHQEYVALALAEKREDDGDDALYFINKAKSAAMGESVGPQPLEERKLPESAKGDLANARLQLVNKLWKGATEVTPAAAARAQAMFDCWMQEQEENNQPKDIAACRDGFEKAYALLGTPAPKMAMKKEMPEPMPMMKLPFPYHVYFATDSADLDGAAMTVIKQAFADFRLHKPGKVVLSGHTDTVGNAKYNAGLARHRTGAVGNALMELGIPRATVERTSFGEEKPAVKTPDNTNEEFNRVVKITFER
ncbi:MAG: OmpA family protein [Rhodospirillales bacterium]|nr:OmpA family protein [Rhodospirillales bacterium]